MGKYLIIFFASLLYGAMGLAQSRPISIQAANQQAFYITVAKKTYISDNKGHLVITTLKSGKYELSVGFIKGNSKEVALNFVFENKSTGNFLLVKNTKGDISIEEQAAAVAKVEKPETKSGDTAKKNNFTDILSDVISDSLVSNGEQEIAKNMPVKEEAKKTVITDYPAAIATPASKYRLNRPATEPVRKVDDAPDVVIGKFSGLEEQFGDSSNSDKINERPKTRGNPFFFKRTDTSAAAKPQSEVSLRIAELGMTQVEAVQDKAAMGNLSAPVSTSSTVTKAVKAPCADKADDRDSERLRRKMYSAENEEKMIEIARKVLRTKCFNTQQIRDLGSLFSSDDGRYRFYDAAYPYVSDGENYPSLESMLIDSYYKNRFKAIIK